MPFHNRFYTILSVPPYGPVSESYNSDDYVRGPWEVAYRSFTPWSMHPDKLTDDPPLVQDYYRVLPNAPWTTQIRQCSVRFISPPLKAQTLGGTIDLCLGLKIDNADMDWRYRVVVWVSAGNDYAWNARGTALDYNDPAGRTFPTVFTGWSLAAPQPLSPIEVQDGDFLVVEVGSYSDADLTPTSPTRNAYIHYAPMSGPPPTGTYYPDLAPGDTDTLLKAGWVHFSQPIEIEGPPSNDECATPIVIPSVPYDSGYVPAMMATYNPATDLSTTCNSADQGRYQTMWWQYTAAQTGILRVDSRSDGQNLLVVYTGSCGALTQVACAFSYQAGGSILKVPVTIGTTYIFRIGARFHLDVSGHGLVARYVTVPTNDMFAGRTVIPSLPFHDASDLTLATAEPGEPFSPVDWTNVPGQSVWYEWTADSEPGNVRIDTMASEMPSEWSVWQKVPMTTFPLPPSTDLYDQFNLPDQTGLYWPWQPSTVFGGVGLDISSDSAVSSRTAPLFSGSYWSNNRYGISGSYNFEFWGTIRGTFTTDVDVVEIDALTSSNPSLASRTGFWVKAYRSAAGYHAQLGRWNNNVSTTLGTSTLPGPITGIGIRRLGSSIYLWVQRGGVWTTESTVTDASFPTNTMAAHIGIASASPGSVAFEEFGGGTLATAGFHGELWVEVYSCPWTNTMGDGWEYYYFDQANGVFRPTPGQTYYITIFTSGNYGSLMDVVISRVPAPVNETCATALNAGAIPCYQIVDFTGAAEGQMEIVPLPEDCDIFTMEQNDSGKVLWFKWTADRTARMNFNTFGPPSAGPYTEVVIYTGECGRLVPFMCDGLNLNNWQTQIIFEAVQGTTYYWRIDSQARIEGPLYFCLDEDYDYFFDGDLVVGADWVYLFAQSGAFRHLVGVSGHVPTASGTDPNTGILYQALFYGNYIMRMNGRLEELSRFYTEPGLIPEVPGFFSDGRLFVGHWGDQSTWGIEDMVDPTFAIRQFEPDSGALIAVHLAKQELTGTAWVDPSSDNQTIVYTSYGRKLMQYDVNGGFQMPDLMTVPGEWPTFQARGLRQRPNGEYLLADRTEVKRLAADGTVLQVYPIPGSGTNPAAMLQNDDLNVIDQSPDGSSFWIGDQDSTDIHHVDVATGEILLTLPGGPFGLWGPYYHQSGAGQLCGLSIIGGFRAGTFKAPDCQLVADLEPPPGLLPWTDLGTEPAGPAVTAEEGFAGMLGVSAFGELSLGHNGLTTFSDECS